MSYDITWCENKACPLRPRCKRNSDRIDPNYKWPLSYALFSSGKNGKCDGFWDAGNEYSSLFKSLENAKKKGGKRHG